MATVQGPTPPGTGVISPAFFDTPEKHNKEHFIWVNVDLHIYIYIYTYTYLHIIYIFVPASDPRLV